MKKKNVITEPDIYIIPSKNDEMRLFVKKFKIDMMEHIVSNITFAIENKLPMVEIFQFKNSSYVVTITSKEFMLNIEHISQFYKEHEIFEYCARADKLLQTLKNIPC